MFNSKMGQISRPLLTWTTNKLNQIIGAAKDKDMAFSWKSSKNIMITMGLGMIPASVAISMLLDEYDEHVLSKKSNMIGFNWNDPGQTAAALSERLARIGTFGLAGDVIDGLRVFGSDGDTRGISFDQRVVFMNEIMSAMSLVNTAVHQHGDLTYDSFWRPFINTIGGSSFLQYGQIINNMTMSMAGTPVFQSEYEVVKKLNALNYLRAAGRLTGLDVKVGDGGTPMPTALHPYISKMVLAAYGDNDSEFMDAYKAAVDEARNEGSEDAVEQVRRSFESYEPLRYVFQTTPDNTQLARMMMAISDKGRGDVMDVINSYNRYAAQLGIRTDRGPGPVARNSKGARPTAFMAY